MTALRIRLLVLLVACVVTATGCSATSAGAPATTAVPASPSAAAPSPSTEGGEAAAPVAPTPEGNAEITRVVDGDTVQVKIDGKTERVRLIGVDTPETVDPRRPAGCYGQEASDFTKSLLPPGTAVALVLDAEARDRYGRLLAYVYRASDGLFVNAELARQGYANVLTIPPNVAHADELVALVGEARSANRGLWGRCGA